MQTFEEPMLGFKVDTKKILNNHEQRFTYMDIFQANTNASLKNIETQVGQLALSLQKQFKDTFPSDTQKNLKNCLAVMIGVNCISIYSVFLRCLCNLNARFIPLCANITLNPHLCKF